MEFCQLGLLIPKQGAFLDHRGDWTGHHLLPTGFVALNLGKDISGKDFHDRRIKADDWLEKMIFEKVCVQIPQVEYDLEIGPINPHLGCQRARDPLRSRGGAAGVGGLAVPIVGALSHRINVEFGCVFEETAKGFEDPPIQVLVVLLVKNLEQVINTYSDANHFLGITPEIGSQPVKFEVIRDQNVIAEGAENIDSGEEVFVVDVSRCQQIVHRDFHQYDGIDAAEQRLL